jgi:hypothetical protein
MTKQADPVATLQCLKKFAEYEPETGKFICTHTGKGRTVPIGGELGHISKTVGYKYIVINGSRFSCHALAYLWMTGSWYDGQIDHVNGNRTDNRWRNLRVTTSRGNQCNRLKPGGVGYHGASGKWRAYITDNGKAIHLGLFNTEDEARSFHSRAYSLRQRAIKSDTNINWKSILRQAKLEVSP